MNSRINVPQVGATRPIENSDDQLWEVLFRSQRNGGMTLILIVPESYGVLQTISRFEATAAQLGDTVEVLSIERMASGI